MSKARPGSVEALERSPGHLLHRVLQLALDIYAEEAGAGLTQRQYAVLCAVSAEEGLSQSGLVRATGIDRSTLAEMVARMIARDLLTRERSVEDARANTVRLTPEGRLALAAAGPRAQAADRRLLSLLGAKKRDAFVEALRRLAKAGEMALALDGETAAAEAPQAAASPEGEPTPTAKPKKAKKSGKGGKKKARKARAEGVVVLPRLSAPTP